MIFALLAVAGITLGVLLVAFWPRVLSFLKGPCRDFLEAKIGRDIVKWYPKFLMWLDDKVVFTRGAVRFVWQKFDRMVVRIRSLFRGNEDGSYRRRTEVVTRLGETKGLRQVSEENIPLEELPEDIREKFMGCGEEEVEIDDKKLVEEKTGERCEQVGIPKEAIFIAI